MTEDASTDPYCPRRTDNRKRWAFIEQHLEDEHRRALDVGCAEGYFTNALADRGLSVVGLEVDEDRYEVAHSAYGDDDRVEFRQLRLTPENVADLPRTDVTLVLTVHHHWVDAFGIDDASRMLLTLGRLTDRLFYEPPGSWFLSPANPIEPGESITRYGDYLRDLFDGAIEIRDVELFDHVDEELYADRQDPLFVVDTTRVE